MNVRKIEYRDEDTVLEATVASESNRKRPVILIFHSWEGKGKFFEQRAVEIARLGYVGVALDMYGKGILSKSNEESASLMNPFLADRKKLLKRALSYKSLLDQIEEADETNVAAVGYSFGGLCALDLVRSGEDLKAAISFYGLLHAPKDEDMKPIDSRVLVFHGFEDPLIPEKDLLSFGHEMTGRKADWQLHIFGGAKHAFTNPDVEDPSAGKVYHAPSDRRSWSQMKALFSEVFSLD